MKITSMELLGIMVHDLDAAVARYSDLFGLEFHIFTPNVDYSYTWDEAGADTAPTLLAGARLAMDTDGLFELVEMPGADEGIRNIHYRVDDIDAAKAHFVARGLRVVKDLKAGTVREVIFDGRDLNGVRACLVHYEGPSFAAALLASPPPSEAPVSQPTQAAAPATSDA